LLREPAVEAVEVAELVVALKVGVAVDRADSVLELSRSDGRREADEGDDEAKRDAVSVHA